MHENNVQYCAHAINKSPVNMGIINKKLIYHAFSFILLVSLIFITLSDFYRALLRIFYPIKKKDKLHLNS